VPSLRRVRSRSICHPIRATAPSWYCPDLFSRVRKSSARKGSYHTTGAGGLGGECFRWDRGISVSTLLLRIPRSQGRRSEAADRSPSPSPFRHAVDPMAPKSPAATPPPGDAPPTLSRLGTGRFAVDASPVTYAGNAPCVRGTREVWVRDRHDLTERALRARNEVLGVVGSDDARQRAVTNTAVPHSGGAKMSVTRARKEFAPDSRR
jgi:hypothetical protein